MSLCSFLLKRREDSCWTEDFLDFAHACTLNVFPLFFSQGSLSISENNKQIKKNHSKRERKDPHAKDGLHMMKAQISYLTQHILVFKSEAYRDKCSSVILLLFLPNTLASQLHYRFPADTGTYLLHRHSPQWSWRIPVLPLVSGFHHIANCNSIRLLDEEAQTSVNLIVNTSKRSYLQINLIKGRNSGFSSLQHLCVVCSASSIIKVSISIHYILHNGTNPRV